MYNGLLHGHSGLRWLAVIFLVLAIVKAFSGWLGKKEYNKVDNLVAILLVSFIHLQFILGLALYFMSGRISTIGASMKDATARFWALEHGLMMLIAIVLITVGRAISKKASTSELKHKKGAIFYTLAFVLILWAGVIKPYLLGRAWF